MKSLFPKIYLGTSLIIAINILYFIWQPYEKCIISFPLRDTWIPDIFTNIIYSLLYFGVLIILFFKSLNNGFIFWSVKTVVKMFGALFLLQLPLEFVKFITKAYIPQLRFVVNDICTTIGFFIGLLILFKISNTNISKKTKRFVFLFLVLVFVIVGIQAIRSVCFEDVLYANNKYLSGSMFIYVEEQNYQFVCEILSIICETVNSLLIFLTFLFATKKDCVIDDKIKAVEDSPNKIITKIVAYSLLLIVAFLTIAPFKTLVLPYSSLAPATGISMLLPEHRGEPNAQLHKGFANKSINRYISPKYVQSVYSVSNICFGSNNTVFYEFNINYSMLENLPQELDNLVLYEFVFDNTKISFYTFGNDLLIIKTETGYRFIELKNIDSLQEDEILTECIKHMLTEGVFSYFEYGCDYLKKHDNEFIKTYIERYAKGDFDLKEIQNVYNTDINRNYIQEIAKEVKE